jgi:hypothetical protein
VAGPDLLDKAIEAHGGLERFQAAGVLTAQLSCGGFAFAMRFKRGALSSFQGRVSTGDPRVELSPYPDGSKRGVLERDAVRIEAEDKTVLSERENARAAFRGLRHNLWWDDLDLLYFAGYALWNYVCAPFMFVRPGFEVAEVAPWEENGERWRRLHVRFPADIPTHSPEQDFYFDDEGLLRRLDYTAEVFGNWAKAAHYCWDHREFSGLVVPTRRKVFPRRRDGRPRPHPTLVWIEIEDVAVAGPLAPQAATH